MLYQSIGSSAICHHLSTIMLVASFHQPMDDNSPWAFSTCRTLLVHTQGIQKKGELSKDVLFFQQCDHLPSPCQQMIWSDFTSYIIYQYISYIIHHTSYIICHISYIIHHISYIINHISYFIHRTSYILHPTSYIIHHTSYIIYHHHVVFHYNYISDHVIWYYMTFDLIWYDVGRWTQILSSSVFAPAERLGEGGAKHQGHPSLRRGFRGSRR